MRSELGGGLVTPSCKSGLLSSNARFLWSLGFKFACQESRRFRARPARIAYEHEFKLQVLLADSLRALYIPMARLDNTYGRFARLGQTWKSA